MPVEQLAEWAFNLRLDNAKQKALRQKTLRTLYDTGHALHDVWAGVQECR